MTSTRGPAPLTHCPTCLDTLDTHPAQGCSCGWPDCLERAAFRVGTRVRGLLVPRCDRHARAALAHAERYGLVVVVQRIASQEDVLPL